jgi:apolipoprotein N-acyltransferase
VRGSRGRSRREAREAAGLIERRGDEGADGGVVAADDFGRAAIGGDAGAIEHDDAIGTQQGVRQIMRDHQRGQMLFAVQGDEAIPQAGAGFRVERAEGLIEQQQFRFGGECAGEADAAGLAAGQLPGVAPGKIARKLDKIEQRIDALGDLGAAPAKQAQHGGDIFGDGPVREQANALNGIADATAQRGGIAGGDITALHAHLAGAGVDEAIGEAQQGGFAGARCAGERDKAAGGHGERHLIKDDYAAAPHADGGIFEHRRGGRRLWGGGCHRARHWPQARAAARPAITFSWQAGQRHAFRANRWPMPSLRLSYPASIFAALIGGGVASLGFAPWSLVPVALLGIVAFVGLVDTAATWRRAALLGWIFGVGHFCVGLTWIAKAFTYQAKMPPVLGWVAVVGLSMFLALYVALAAGLARSLAKSPLARVLVLAAAWVLAEWLRGWVLSGFEWNPLGAMWVDVPGLRQLAQFGGALSLSGISMLIGGGIWLAVRTAATGPDRAFGALLVACVALMGLAGTGLNRDHYYPDNPVVYVVQPNIGQDQKYVEGSDEQHLQTYLDLTAGALATARQGKSMVAAAVEAPVIDEVGGTMASAGAQRQSQAATEATAAFSDSIGDPNRGALIVWSESAVPYAVEEDAAARAQLAAVLGPKDLLLFGAPAVIRDATGKVTALTNSLFVIDAKGVLHGRYDKAHLVPLGEYVPARALMTSLGLARLTPGDLDFLPGPGPRTLVLPGFPSVGAIICYEIIFGGHVVEPGKRPSWIANISNDAWFGPSGPPQHLAQARMRAIEEGLPIVRATPTGISAIIDGHGNIEAQLGPGAKSVMTANLPPPLPETLYARLGNQVALLFAALLLLGGLGLDRVMHRELPGYRGRVARMPSRR